ncbi:MAG: threonine--tRNA ligase [Bdellovibrionota bacterium]
MRSLNPQISIYRHSGFFDLCSGPHVKEASEIPIDGFKVHRFAGAYWKGDERNPMLQRIYALCFESKEILEKHLKSLKEAKKRDHRLIGKEMDLFFFSDDAPGMPYWLPNGLQIYEELISFWRKEHKKRGYKEISSPLIHHQDMWEVSGHWEHFRDEMFLMRNPKNPDKFLGMKPMNCPDAMVVFNYKKRSYRELPLRLADCDSLHRFEKSGALHGLLRVRRFSQDDAHIFLMQSQIKQEINNILDLVDRFYAIFGLSYSFRLGLRPKKFVGGSAQWDDAEEILLQILKNRFVSEKFSIDPGEGAFYGPKIDIMIEDSLGRKWQMGSIQLDFQLPGRFGCKFVNQQGADEVPIVIHRVIYGSMERFIGILLEHFAGRLPPWIAPIQVALLPVAERHSERCAQFMSLCENAGLRVIEMLPKDRIPARIRMAEKLKIPFVVVFGDKEAASDLISLRIGKKQQHLSLSIIELIERVRRNCSSLALVPLEEMGNDKEA